MASCLGLEMFYTGTLSQIQSKHDAVVTFIHWSFVNHGFKCLGLGEGGVRPEKTSELLPLGWNTTDENYVLRYAPAANPTDKHVLKVLRIEDTLLVHILRESDNKVVNANVRTSDFVNPDHLKDFDRCFKNVEELKNLISDQLFKELKKEDTKQKQSSSSAGPSEVRTDRDSDQEADPLRVPSRRPPQRTDPDWGERVDPFSVGRGDLDPFSGASGGMFMDPMRSGFPGAGFDSRGGLGMPGWLPRGAVPPGARFDPIGPPGPSSGRGPIHPPHSGQPDPDHLPAPGYDDMFM